MRRRIQRTVTEGDIVYTIITVMTIGYSYCTHKNNFRQTDLMMVSLLFFGMRISNDIINTCFQHVITLIRFVIHNVLTSLFPDGV
jgi:hypothetical protein